MGFCLEKLQIHTFLYIYIKDISSVNVPNGPFQGGSYVEWKCIVLAYFNYLMYSCKKKSVLRLQTIGAHDYVLTRIVYTHENIITYNFSQIV